MDDGTCAHNFAVFDGGGGLECLDCGALFVRRAALLEAAAERDTALSKLDELQKDLHGPPALAHAFRLERNAARDRVAELESRLDSALMLTKECALTIHGGSGDRTTDKVELKWTDWQELRRLLGAEIYHVSVVERQNTK